jgi:hypothetical protein
MLLEAVVVATTATGLIPIIMSVIGLVGAGGVVKMYKAYLKGRKEKRDSADKVETLFRETLLVGVKSHMVSGQPLLVTFNFDQLINS